MSRLRLLTAIAFALTALAAGNASARVPQGFVGVDLGVPVYPTTPPGADLANQLDLMVASGVETIRVPIDWAAAQPYRSWSKVPAAQQDQFSDLGGIPTKVAPIDQLVGLAAYRGITVLPTILNAPSWDAQPFKGGTVDVPKTAGPYAAFVKALVKRYGPNGRFWLSQPRVVPIREWQIWNEPNIRAFWPAGGFPGRYLTLLKAAHDAIKSVDPGAQVVLAGLPNYSWVNLAQIYRVRGARSLFDIVAIHPYTRDPQGVITILRLIRRTMNASHDGRKPIIADEISWPSSKGKTIHNLGLDFATTEAGQARNVAQEIPLLAQNRARLGLLGFDYYTWATVEEHNGFAFTFSGLLKIIAGRYIEKPAFSAFRSAALALERCKQKGAVATVCAKPA